MKISNLVRVVSLIFYFIIILQGQIIGMPFIFILIFSIVVDIGSAQWISSLMAIFGLVLIFFSKQNGNKWVVLMMEAFIFILLLFPLLERLTSVPLNLFNYAGFIIPFFGFILFYMAYLLLLIIDGFLKKYKV